MFIDKQFRRLLVIDGSYMLHRSLHIPEIFSLKNSEGNRVGGIYQFLRSLKYEVKKHSYYFPVVCLDHGLSNRRTSLFLDYKNREVQRSTYTPDKLAEVDEYVEVYREQRDALIEVLKSFGIPVVRINGWEADDLIYIMTLLTDDCIVVSDDKDFYQIVSENVTVSRPLAGEVVSVKRLRDKGLTPTVCLVARCLTGDPSDNIPKVAEGLGDKNAERIAKIIVENPKTYLNILYESSKKVDVKFVENHNKYLLNKKLIDLKEVNQDITEDVLQIVVNSISSILGKSNYFKAVQWIGFYEIKDVDVDDIMMFLRTPQKHFL